MGSPSPGPDGVEGEKIILGNLDSEAVTTSNKSNLAPGKRLNTNKYVSGGTGC